MKRQKRQSNHRSYLALACLLWTALLTICVLAADVTGLTDTYIKLNSEGSATWTANGTKISGSVTGTESWGCSEAKDGTLTIKNNKSIAATLSFNYTITLNNGKVSIAGTSVTQNGSYTQELSAGGSVAIKITSAEGKSTTSIQITNISLISDVTATVTYQAPQNGSYTVDGVAVTSEKEVTKSSTQTTTLVATPASGYRFYGWHNLTKDSFFSYTASYTGNFDEDMSVEPMFVPSTAPVFDVSGKIFIDLNEATTYATNNNKNLIVLVANGTLPAGDYTIPNGKTLLIPFDAANTVYTTKPEVVYGSHATPSAYKTLTMANGAKITVASGGKLCVPSKLSATGTGSGSWNGTPTGKHGRITMNAGSSITLNSGAGLYCYGYISGSGTVTAESGSTVYECFQIRSWRGGSATTSMINKTVFPMNQYYVQNIEASLKLEAGATEKVYTSVNMSSRAYPTSATFVGIDGMFRLGNGWLTKRFDSSTDRLIIDAEGNATLGSMSLSLAGQSVQTGNFVLPINSNITVNINSGTTTVNQDLAMLPGSQLSIAKDAALTISKGKNVYVYDQDQWGAYAAASLQLVPVGYSTVNGTEAKRTKASLVDAKIDVNGTLTVAGALYTTESGANIISSEKTGKVVLNAAAGTAKTTQQATQSGTSMTYVDINITAAKLLNCEGSYTATAGAAAGTTYYYCTTCNSSGVWETKHTVEQKLYNVTISWPELAFTYTRSTSTTYTWDGEEKKYEGKITNRGSWSGPIGIDVCNKSSAGAVNAQFAFTQVGNTWAAMQFSAGEASSWNDGTSTLSLPKPDDPETGIEKTVKATLSGTPAADFTESQIGTITVTITAS